VYGPVHTVVWQGSVGDRRPYADLVAQRIGIPAIRARGGLRDLGRRWPMARTDFPLEIQPLICRGSRSSARQTGVRLFGLQEFCRGAVRTTQISERGYELHNAWRTRWSSTTTKRLEGPKSWGTATYRDYRHP
jgi:hypothetical protein